MADETFSVDRAVWTAMQSQRPVTLDELEMLIGRDAGECLTYLNILLRHQYAAIAGIKRAASGEALPLFRLTRATGPEAPSGNGNDLFVDPNLMNQPSRPDRPIPALVPLPLPTMVGRVRFASLSMGPSFTREEMAAVVGRGREFAFGWGRLIYRKELKPAGVDDNGRELFQTQFKHDLDPIRAYFKANLGLVITRSKLKTCVPSTTHGAAIRQALDMLAAEGYSVEMAASKKSDVAKYRVHAPKEGVNQ